MGHQFLKTSGDVGPTSEYAVEIDGLEYTFLLTEADAESVENNRPIDSTDLPTITTLSPNTVEVGGPVTTLTVTGTGFTDSSLINFNGTELPSTVASETSISADIDPSSAVAGVVPVYVSVNVSESNIVDFTFTPVARR